MPVLEFLETFEQFGETGPSPPKSWSRFTESCPNSSTLNFTSNEVLLEPKHHLRVKLRILVLSCLWHLGDFGKMGSNILNHEQVYAKKNS